MEQSNENLINFAGIMKYSHDTHTNIIPKKNFEDLVRGTFDIISTNICKSLGPLGSSATIIEGLNTEATKDGYSILKNYRFSNKYMRMIYNLILAPCRKLNNTVGDATTTVIAFTSMLFNRYLRSKSSLEQLYRLPRQFNRAWDEIIADLVERIQEQATTIDSQDYDTIYNIAYVVSNGNDEVSKEIAKVYSECKSPCITQKDSPTNKSYISPVGGFELPANLISEIFVKNQDMTTEEKDVMTLTFDFTMELDMFENLVAPINDVARSMGKKLIVIAPQWDNVLCETFLQQYINFEVSRKGDVNCIMLQYLNNKLAEKQLIDFATILRSKVVNKNMAEEMVKYVKEEGVDRLIESALEDPEFSFWRVVGIADKVLMSTKRGSIFNVSNIEEDSRYQEVLASAENELAEIISKTDNEKTSYSHKIYEANARVSRLKMLNYIYYIGADSALQKNILWASIDDTIKCVRSATKYGVVPGCQLSIEKATIDLQTEILNKYSEEDIASGNISTDDALKISIIYLLHGAVLDVYSAVIHGPEGTGIFKTIPGWDSVNEDNIEEFKELAIQKGAKIIKESINRFEVYDVETLEFNKNIITSAETDKMVLIAASELIKILISGNQCIYLDPTSDDTSEIDTMEIRG